MNLCMLLVQLFVVCHFSCTLKKLDMIEDVCLRLLQCLLWTCCKEVSKKIYLVVVQQESVRFEYTERSLDERRFMYCTVWMQ